MRRIQIRFSHHFQVDVGACDPSAGFLACLPKYLDGLGNNGVDDCQKTQTQKHQAHIAITQAKPDKGCNNAQHDKQQ